MHKKKGLNILVTHAPWNDRGDEAAIRAMVDSLKAELIVDKITMVMACKTLSQFPYDDIQTIKLPLTCPDNPIPKVTFLLVYLGALLSMITFGRLSITGHGRKFLKAIDEADFVIHAPGGADVGDLYGSNLIADFPSLFELIVTKLKGKPFLFYAPSMGPFTRPYWNIFRKYILKKADTLIVREEISYECLKTQLGLTADVALDSALQNDIPKDYLDRYNNITEITETLKKNKVIGIAITDVMWHPVHGKNQNLGLNIKKTFTELTRHLIKEGYNVLLIPILFGERLEEQDVGLLEDIYALFQKEEKGKVFLLPTNIDAHAQQVLIAELYCMISIRYHGTVFSVKGGVPFIAISYEDKITGFVKKIECTDLMLKVEDISTEKIIDKFEYLKDNYAELQMRLKEKQPFLKEESRKTTQIVVKKLRQLNLA